MAIGGLQQGGLPKGGVKQQDLEGPGLQKTCGRTVRDFVSTHPKTAAGVSLGSALFLVACIGAAVKVQGGATGAAGVADTDLLTTQATGAASTARPTVKMTAAPTPDPSKFEFLPPIQTRIIAYIGVDTSLEKGKSRIQQADLDNRLVTGMGKTLGENEVEVRKDRGHRRSAGDSVKGKTAGSPRAAGSGPGDDAKASKEMQMRNHPPKSKLKFQRV